MPALPAVPSVIRLRWIGSDAADVALGSHLTFRYTGTAPSSAQLGTTATAWGNLWNTNMAPVTDTGYTLTTIEIIDLSTNTGGTTETPVSHPGTRAGAQIPLNTAFTVGLVTTLRRRGGHWHSQVRAGVQTDLATPQSWTPAFVSAFTAAWGGWITGIQNSLWSGATALAPVGVQYYGPPNYVHTSGSGRVSTRSTQLTTPVVYPAISWTYRTRLGSQRRRLG